MIKVLCVGMGGFFGSASRYLLGIWVYRLSSQHWFPFATLTVNILGSFLIGFLGGLFETKHLINDNIRLFLLVGLLGGFTTFSSFSYETNHLIRDAQHIGASMNIVIQIIACLTAAWLGHMISMIIAR